MPRAAEPQPVNEVNLEARAPVDGARRTSDERTLTRSGRGGREERAHVACVFELRESVDAPNASGASSTCCADWVVRHSCPVAAGSPRRLSVSPAGQRAMAATNWRFDIESPRESCGGGFGR